MKKYIVSGLVLSLVSFGAIALAENSNSGNTNTNTNVSSTTQVSASPMMINIGPRGNAMLRGQVVSVGTDSLVIKSWGGSWTVDVSATTKILSANKLLTDFKVDDFVGVMGTVSTDGNFIINAKILREWGIKKDDNKDGIPDDQEDNHGVNIHANANGILNGGLNLNLGGGHGQGGEGN